MNNITSKIEIKLNENLDILELLLNINNSNNPKDNKKWISNIGIAVMINRNSININL